VNGKSPLTFHSAAPSSGGYWGGTVCKRLAVTQATAQRLVAESASAFKAAFRRNSLRRELFLELDVLNSPAGRTRYKQETSKLDQG